MPDGHIRDVDDAIAWGLAIRDTTEAFEHEHPGSIIDARDVTPDPHHPGRAFAERARRIPAVAHAMEGGNVLFGEWDCSRCGKAFYMEIGHSHDGAIVDSIGGVLYSDVILCDDCSPI